MKDISAIRTKTYLYLDVEWRLVLLQIYVNELKLGLDLWLKMQMLEEEIYTSKKQKNQNVCFSNKPSSPIPNNLGGSIPLSFALAISSLFNNLKTVFNAPYC